MNLVEKTAAWLARPPSETAQLKRDSRRFTSKHLVFFGFFLALAGMYGTEVVFRVRGWNNLHLHHPVATSAWHILPVPATEVPCPYEARGGSSCPANPAATALWSSPELRRIERDPISQTRNAKRTSNYWIGLSIGPEDLRVAARERSTEFLIGRIFNPYRIWVDGEYVKGGPGWEETEPVFLNVPLKRLLENRPLRIAIRIYNLQNTLRAPDWLNFDKGGEGFVDTRKEDHYRTMVNFTDRVRPFALMLAYSSMALLFFFFWQPARVKQEYYYIALFALCSAFYQAKQVDLWSLRFNHQVGIVIETLMRFYLACFGLLLGLSFARARQVFFRWGTPIALLLPLPFLPKVYYTAEYYSIVHALRTWMLPVAYGLAAGVCLLQAYYLWRKKAAGGTYLPVRIQRLLLFGCGMLGLTVFYFLEFRHLLPMTIRVYTLGYGFEHFAFMMFFAVAALHEYGEQEQMLAKTPVSQYHQRPILPEKITGAVLVVDLKNSEALFKRGAATGDAGKLVDHCLSRMWEATSRCGGVVLQTEGDALRAFFDQDSCESPLAAALEACDEMAGELAKLGAEINFELNFRGGISLGDIRPIWQEVGSERMASWVEAGSTNVFVESARVMELERKVPGHDDARTRVVVSEPTVRGPGSVSGSAGGRWIERGLSLSAKHDVVYEVAVYAPSAQTPKKLSRAA